MPWKGLPPHRIASSRALLGTEETPLCRGRDCPPTALFPRLWYFVVMTCLLTCRWDFRGKSRGTMVKFCPHDHVLEAEAAIKSPLQASRIIYVHVGSSSVNDRLVTLCSSWRVLGWVK